MADVQVENGHTRIANEILENIARVKLNGTQARLLFIIWRYTYGFQRKEHNMSLKFLSNATGCDNRQIKRELDKLQSQKIIKQNVKDGSYRRISFNKNYEQWGTTIGESTNGKNTNGELTIGESTNPTIGESTKGTIGESTNQERNKENSKEKIKEEEAADPVINSLIQNNIIFSKEINRTMAEDLNDIYTTFGFVNPEQIIIEAIKDAVRGNGRTWKFIYKKLHLWRKFGVKTVDDIEKLNERLEKPKYGTNKNNSLFAQGEESKKRQATLPPFDPEEAKRLHEEIMNDPDLV